ncbi:MAG: redoxin domain-containing protein [Phycisphaeraceae bacterium]|nr:redoxin domain-containing protein [Phycisphaeraceae bacterium]
MMAVFVSSILSLASLSAPHDPAKGAPTPPAEAESAAMRTFTVGEGDRRFDSSTARGRYLAIHFLLGDECPFCTRMMREYEEKLPTVAGVRQIFVQNIPPEAFDAAVRANPEGTRNLYRDADGRLAEMFKIPGGYRFHGMTMAYPALVVLDGEGREVFRHIGASNADRLPFEQFAARIADLSRDPAVSHANAEKGLALAGFDPVAYVDQSAATPGDPKIVSMHRGLTYRFSSARHRALFNDAPEKYAPAYGGWCATAMAEGRKVEVNPRSFKIVGGRLMLFYKGAWGDALKDWNKDEPGLTRKADEAWSRTIAGR